jgi:predicted DNA-binding transcriptional regulator AlpA
MTNAPKLAYTVNEGMAALGIGRTKFYELARAGKIDLRKLGGRTVATAASLQRLVEDSEAA